MKTVLDFAKAKAAGQKISMVTCYDATFAKLIQKTEIDVILVGDSAAMVIHGHDSTLPIDTNTLAQHVAAVRRGLPDRFIIGDLPFMSTHKGLSEAMSAIEILMKAGANAVKLEGLTGQQQVIRQAIAAGVPVMGHLGLTPQSVNMLGGYRVQGRSERAAADLTAAAEELADLGCFSIVLECVPTDLARSIQNKLQIPVIGIGAGPHVDGQVLVLHDLLGLNVDFKPRFVRRFAKGAEVVEAALNDYILSVQNGSFPGPEESFEWSE